MEFENYDRITRDFVNAVKEQSKKFGRGEVSYASCVGYLEGVLFDVVARYPMVAEYLERETKKLAQEQK